MIAAVRQEGTTRWRAGHVRADPVRPIHRESAAGSSTALSSPGARLRAPAERLTAVTMVAVGLVIVSLTRPAYAQVEVTPTTDGFPGGPMIQKMINWVGQFGLWGSLASILVGAGIWGVSQQFGNGLQAGKGKTLAAAGAIGAVLTGLAPVIVNTLYSAARA